MDRIFDVVIIGAGPAGLTAALYACRARLDVTLLEKACPGGQIILTDHVDNYPGFQHGISGTELIGNMTVHAKRFGLVIEEYKEVTKIEKLPDHWRLSTSDGAGLTAISVIIASGSQWKLLGVPGEDKFRGKGVSYCATCDGPFFRNKEAVVVGGGNAAVEEALFLTRFVKKLTLVHRKSMLRAAKVLQEELLKNPKVEVCLNSEVISIDGDKLIDGVNVKNTETGQNKKIPCQGVFIFIGQAPNTGFLKGAIELDDQGFIITDDQMATSQRGVYAVGDVRKKAFRQVITAASDGALAAYSVEQYINSVKGQSYK